MNKLFDSSCRFEHRNCEFNCESTSTKTTDEIAEKTSPKSNILVKIA